MIWFYRQVSQTSRSARWYVTQPGAAHLYCIVESDVAHLSKRVTVILLRLNMCMIA